jgi:NADPH-dependent 2,4-dienoyl-CoA reductase/sulfur reductase-like enzyme
MADDESTRGDRATADPGAPAARSGLDRRTFLKIAGTQTGLMAAGASTASALTSPKPRAPWIGKQAPDIAVIGGSAWGGWIALNLQRMGAKVTIIDAWGPGNARATSGDESRGIRTSYGDREVGELWSRWARESIERWKRAM